VQRIKTVLFDSAVRDAWATPQWWVGQAVADIHAAAQKNFICIAI
jgi:hypothetical protein